MAKLPKITVSEVMKKHLRIIIFLLVSGVCGSLLAYLANKPEYAIVIAPAVNYILFTIDKELKGEGYVKALK